MPLFFRRFQFKTRPVSLTVMLLVLIGCLGMNMSAVQAENWTEWRGPNRNGISSEKSLPAEWDQDKNVAWRLPLPGEGGATPVVWEDKIFLTSADGEGLALLCISTEGKELWRRTLSDKNVEVRGGLGNSASPSPTTDGNHVWTLVTDGRIACWDMDGNQVWAFDLQERYGEFDIAFGMTSTPIVHEGVIYMQLIHGDGDAETQEAKVVAFAAEDAKPIWEQKRPSDAIAECEHSYASPVLYDDGKQKMLLTHGADYIIAHDLKDGREIWRCGGLNPKEDPNRRYEPTLRFVSTPAAAEGIVVCPTAKNGPVFAIAADRRGNLTDSDAILWIRDQHTPDVPSPLILDDLVYLCRENGMLLVLDRETGDEVYMERTHSHRQPRPRGHAAVRYRDAEVPLPLRPDTAQRVAGLSGPAVRRVHRVNV